MAVGVSSSIANSVMNGLTRNVAWTQPAAFWVKLHIADPGAAGATAAAGNTTRVQATFGASAGGAVANTGALTWASVQTTETYSHLSFWDASTAGTFLGSSALAVSRSVVIGDTFTIAIGALTVTATIVAA